MESLGPCPRPCPTSLSTDTFTVIYNRRTLGNSSQAKSIERFSHRKHHDSRLSKRARYPRRCRTSDLLLKLLSASWRSRVMVHVQKTFPVLGNRGDRRSSQRHRPLYKSTKCVNTSRPERADVFRENTASHVRASTLHVRVTCVERVFSLFPSFSLSFFLSLFPSLPASRKVYGLLWHRVSLYARFVFSQDSIVHLRRGLLTCYLNIIHIERYIGRRETSFPLSLFLSPCFV